MHKSKRCVWRYRPVPWQNAKAEFNTCQDKTMFFLLLVFALTFLTEKCSVSHGHEKTLINSARQTNTPTIRCASAHATLTLLSIMQTGDISWMDLIRNSPYCMQMTTTITTDENNWVLMIDERKRSKLWMVILGYATCTLLTNVFLTEPLRYLAFLTNRGNVQSIFFCKGPASYTAFGVYTVCSYFAHRYQALFSPHITDVLSSQNASLYLCFWSVVPRRPLHLLLCFLSVLAF